MHVTNPCCNRLLLYVICRDY